MRLPILVVVRPGREHDADAGPALPDLPAKFFARHPRYPNICDKNLNVPLLKYEQCFFRGTRLQILRDRTDQRDAQERQRMLKHELSTA
jgi:hypothetical protein